MNHSFPLNYDDEDYNLVEDYLNENIEPSAPYCNTSDRNPFSDPNNLLDFQNVINNMDSPELNLPANFPSEPKAFHYFSLICSFQMITQLRKAMNRKNRDALDQSQLLDDLEDANESTPINDFIDPLNNLSSEFPNTHSIQISKFTNQNIYQFFGRQILLGIADLRSEESYFYEDRINPPLIHQVSFSSFKRIKRFFHPYSHQFEFNNARKYSCSITRTH
eukprot:NODE_278_length_10899_cov_0.613704.p1 type:complete len:220 gc:universal NODE_278_length_10899_cov_0.613704:1755-2414(+)